MREAQENGVPEVKQISREELFQLEPHINKAALGAVLAPGECSVDPFLTPVTMLHEARRSGAQVSRQRNFFFFFITLLWVASAADVYHYFLRRFLWIAQFWGEISGMIGFGVWKQNEDSFKYALSWMLQVCRVMWWRTYAGRHNSGKPGLPKKNTKPNAMRFGSAHHFSGKGKRRQMNARRVCFARAKFYRFILVSLVGGHFISSSFTNLFLLCAEYDQEWDKHWSTQSPLTNWWDIWFCRRQHQKLKESLFIPQVMLLITFVSLACVLKLSPVGKRGPRNAEIHFW